MKNKSKMIKRIALLLIGSCSIVFSVYAGSYWIDCKGCTGGTVTEVVSVDCPGCNKGRTYGGGICKNCGGSGAISTTKIIGKCNACNGKGGRYVDGVEVNW